MKTEYIKEFNGTILGTLETQNNGDQVLKSYSGQILGRYNSSQNITMKYSGYIVSSGNTLTRLLK
jgi:hypothetical protein